MSAFGTVYAAHALYDLIGPGLCFGALAIIAFAAMIAAALHGPWLAGLGLLGALVSPMLVSTNAPNYWVLAVYLLIVTGAGYGAAILRGWHQIGRATLAGSMIWGAMLAVSGEAAAGAAQLYILIQLGIIAFVFVHRPHGAGDDAEANPFNEAAIALAAVSAVACLAVLDSAAAAPVFAGGTAVLLAALAFRYSAAAFAASLAGIVTLVALGAWPDLPRPEPGAAAVIAGLNLPDRVSFFLAFAAGIAGVVAAVSALRLWRGPALDWRAATSYLLAAIVLPLLALLLCWYRVRQFGIAPEFAATSALLAGAFIYAVIQFRRSAGLAHAITMEAFAAGAIAAIALGLTTLLDKGFLTVSLAITAAGAAWVTTRGPIQALRVAVGVLAVAVLLRILWDPAVMAGNAGSMPLFNWLLFGYGVPALCFWLASRWLKPAGEDIPQRLVEGLAILFVGLLVAFQIRHFMHGPDFLAVRTSHIELGLHVAASAGIAAVLMRLDPLDQNVVYRWASLAYGALTLPLAIIGLLLAKSPLVAGELVAGGALINSLLIGYALPAAAVTALWMIARSRRPLILTRPLAALALLLLFAFVSLETRRLFHGPDISLRQKTGEAELWAYSAVWLALGLGILAVGIVRFSRSLRLASAAFILPTILKVFLIDMSGLEGFWRAFSFIGLGATLIGIGLVYQRFVFTDRQRRSP
jgi:uncharacterized membrane protein